MSNFDDRITTGRAVENRFQRYIEKQGFTVIATSQHRDNPSSKLARHFPDFFIFEWCTFVQVKSALNSEKWDNVIAERDSFETCKYLYDCGASVKLVWEFPDGTWRGQDIEKIIPVDTISNEARQNGSGTPAVKIPKSQLDNLPGF